MTNWIDFIYLSIPWAVVVGLLIYFIKNPEKVEKWGSIIAKTFSFASIRWEKAGVAKDIQADINSFAKKMNVEGSSVLPYKAKIKWISSTTKEAFVKNGQVIVKMDYHSNQARNFLYTTLNWVHCGLIPKSRHLIDSKVLQALDFAIINKVLTESNRHDARQIFISEVYEPEARTGTLLEQYCSTFNKLDEQGVLMGVALPEYALLGDRLGSSMPNPQIQAESIAFAVVLTKLANKRHGEDISPTYSGQFINCAIVLVARYETYLKSGLAPYLKYINQCKGNGIKSIYVCGRGNNVSIVKRIKDAYDKSNTIVFDWEKSVPHGFDESLFIHYNLN